MGDVQSAMERTPRVLELTQRGELADGGVAGPETTVD